MGSYKWGHKSPTVDDINPAHIYIYTYIYIYMYNIYIYIYTHKYLVNIVHTALKEREHSKAAASVSDFAAPALLGTPSHKLNENPKP